MRDNQAVEQCQPTFLSEFEVELMIANNAKRGKRPMRFLGSVMLAVLIAATSTGRAQVPEVRFAQQFSMGYLQFDVMRHQDLLQKHAAALGIPAVKVSYIVFNGPDMMNDALLSGAIDVASGGVPGLLTIWGKTNGTGAGGARDFTADDRIALPAPKVSAQAVMLQMAAAAAWGDAAYDRLDALTFALSPPDATAGLLSGHGDFTSAFTVPPHQELQLKDPAIHIVLSSEDVVGISTGGRAWTTKWFHDSNPKLYQALLEAMKEGSEFVASHLRETAEYYAADTKGKIDIDMMVELLKDPRYRYILTPHATMKWAGFMHQVGRLKKAPASWKDLFWPEIWGLDGG